MNTSADPGAGRCRCGHGREAHQHYRRGSDCALCGAAACPRYRAAWRQRLTRWVTLRRG